MTDDRSRELSGAVNRASPMDTHEGLLAEIRSLRIDNARLRDEAFLSSTGDAQTAATAEMLAALKNVQKIISEAALTGFNCFDGDWPERLFASQQVTSAAIKRASLVPSTDRGTP